MDLLEKSDHSLGELFHHIGVGNRDTSIVIWFIAEPRDNDRSLTPMAAGVFPLAEPAFEGFVIFSGWPSKEETFHADVFVERGPVDACPIADEPVMRPFGRRPVHQPGEPRQRDGQYPAVIQAYREHVAGKRHTLGQRFFFND
jgi:hypothetical protein